MKKPEYLKNKNKMEPNFYENIVPSEDKEKKELIQKMSKLLDDSLDTFLEVRKRQQNVEVPLIKFDLKKGKNRIMDELFRIYRSERRETEENNISSHRNRMERLERIRVMQEETENLERLIENDVEVIG